MTIRLTSSLLTHRTRPAGSVAALLASMVFALGAPGCNSTDTNNLKHDVGNLAQNGKQALSNAGLVARVNATLIEIKGVNVQGLHVEAEQGVVTLGGHVGSAQEEQTVVQTTKNIKGVTSVVDHLRVQ